MAIKRAFSMQFPSMQVFKASPRKKFGFIFFKSLAMCHAVSVLSDRAKAQRRGKPPMSVGGKASTLKTIYMRVRRNTYVKG